MQLYNLRNQASFIGSLLFYLSFPINISVAGVGMESNLAVHENIMLTLEDRKMQEKRCGVIPHNLRSMREEHKEINTMR